MTESAFPIVPPANERGEKPPGFPYPEMGLSKREYFAAAALIGMGMFTPGKSVADLEARARWAFAQADAMIKASAEPSND